MKALVLNLNGPLQSWGVDSRFRRRNTSNEPSKSGIVGLLAAAQGRPREADIADLSALTMAVRVDRPGVLVEDFHTARKPGAKNTNLSFRRYRSDAAYTAAVVANAELIEGLRDAISNPAFPLYLGRRSCPAPPDLLGGVFDEDNPESVLRNLKLAPWQASKEYRETLGQTVYLPMARDAHPGEIGESVYDVPVSFSPRHRQYRARLVVRPEPVVVSNEDGKLQADPFMSLAREA